MKKKKVIEVICMDCGKKHRTKVKQVFGVWMGDCDMCGKKDVPVADAAHDFGIYQNKKAKDYDKFQDLI